MFGTVGINLVFWMNWRDLTPSIFLHYFYRKNISNVCVNQPNFVTKKWGGGRLIEFPECLGRDRSDSLSWDKSRPPPFIWFIIWHNQLARNHLTTTIPKLRSKLEMKHQNKTFWKKCFKTVLVKKKSMLNCCSTDRFPGLDFLGLRNLLQKAEKTNW